MNCQNCGIELPKKKFKKYCKDCRSKFGQYHHYWPTVDETIIHTRSVIYWSQTKLYLDLRKYPTSGVPVKCGMCSLTRVIPCLTISRTRAKGIIYTGYCRHCSSSKSIQALRPVVLKNNGRHTTSHGYILININALSGRDFELANTMTNGDRYVQEHRLVMARSINRSLEKYEAVHHLNGIKSDNRIKNLMLTTHDEHAHIETRVYLELKAECERLQAKINELESELASLK